KIVRTPQKQSTKGQWGRRPLVPIGRLSTLRTIFTSHTCFSRPIRLNRSLRPVAVAIKSYSTNLPAGFSEPPRSANEDALRDLIVVARPEWIRIAGRPGADREQLDRIDHPWRATDVEHVTRQQVRQKVGRSAQLHCAAHGLRRAADRYDEHIRKAGQLHESRSHIERLDRTAPSDDHHHAMRVLAQRSDGNRPDRRKSSVGGNKNEATVLIGPEMRRAIRPGQLHPMARPDALTKRCGDTPILHAADMEPYQAAPGISMQGMRDAERAARIASEANLRILPRKIGQRAIRPDADFHDFGRQGAQ